jgi:hypothetical protein
MHQFFFFFFWSDWSVFGVFGKEVILIVPPEGQTEEWKALNLSAKAEMCEHMHGHNTVRKAYAK